MLERSCRGLMRIRRFCGDEQLGTVLVGSHLKCSIYGGQALALGVVFLNCWK